MNLPAGSAGKKLFYLWRIFGTGFCFAVFFLSGALVSWLGVPLLRFRFSDPVRRQKRMRHLTHRWFGVFMGLMQTVGVVSGVTVRNREALDVDEPCLVVANHPTLIDVVALVAEIPEIICVVKMDLWNSPMVGPVVKACGYIPDRSGVDLYESCLETIEGGHSILFFPEGSRSPVGELRPFSRVAAQVAHATGRPLVPVLIDCNVPTLKKDQPWYDVPPEPLAMTLEFHDPFTVDADPDTPSKAVTERTTLEMMDFFRERLGYA